MITTIYKCDKCAEQTTVDQFWNVDIKLSRYSTPQYTSHVKGIQVCRPCLESLGICAKEKQNESTPPPPTTEELIREIIVRAGGLVE